MFGRSAGRGGRRFAGFPASAGGSPQEGGPQEGALWGKGGGSCLFYFCKDQELPDSPSPEQPPSLPAAGRAAPRGHGFGKGAGTPPGRTGLCRGWVTPPPPRDGGRGWCVFGVSCSHVLNPLGTWSWLWRGGSAPGRAFGNDDEKPRRSSKKSF